MTQFFDLDQCGIKLHLNPTSFISLTIIVIMESYSLIYFLKKQKLHTLRKKILGFKENNQPINLRFKLLYFEVDIKQSSNLNA